MKLGSYNLKRCLRSTFEDVYISSSCEIMKNANLYYIRLGCWFALRLLIEAKYSVVVYKINSSACPFTYMQLPCSCFTKLSTIIHSFIKSLYLRTELD